MNCACVFVDSDSDVIVQCGRTVIATCSECGMQQDVSIGCVECCEQSFCGVCYDYNATVSCLRKSVRSQPNVFDSHKAK